MVIIADFTRWPLAGPPATSEKSVFPKKVIWRC